MHSTARCSEAVRRQASISTSFRPTSGVEVGDGLYFFPFRTRPSEDRPRGVATPPHDGAGTAHSPGAVAHEPADMRARRAKNPTRNAI